ncbi:hypothetical protein V8E54_013825, partial [Elaphomyces granulatus]
MATCVGEKQISYHIIYIYIYICPFDVWKVADIRTTPAVVHRHIPPSTAAAAPRARVCACACRVPPSMPGRRGCGPGRRRSRPDLFPTTGRWPVRSTGWSDPGLPGRPPGYGADDSL